MGTRCEGTSVAAATGKRDRDIPRECHVHVLVAESVTTLCCTLRRQHPELSLTVMAAKSKAR